MAIIDYRLQMEMTPAQNVPEHASAVYYVLYVYCYPESFKSLFVSTHLICFCRTLHTAIAYLQQGVEAYVMDPPTIQHIRIMFFTTGH